MKPIRLLLCTAQHNQERI